MDRSYLANLTAFIAVAEQRSFRAAASRLHVTPSALSHLMRQLEETSRGPLAASYDAQRLGNRRRPAFVRPLLLNGCNCIAVRGRSSAGGPYAATSPTGLRERDRSNMK